MRATLWQGSGEEGELVRESLRGLFTLAGIDVDVVDTRDDLLAAAARSRRAGDMHILVIDCYHGEPGDTNRCADVIDQTSQTKPPIHVVHPDEQVVRDLEGIAGRPLGWLPSEFTPSILREKLHALRAVATATTAVERPALTTREREVAELIAAGLSNGEIEKALHLMESTVKTYVRTFFRKFKVKTRPAFIAKYRGGGREG